ncbi:MAG TPA: hypothetical protein VFK70_07700, partial [Vicinamibacteria bacterium]|nr:hypothetical protein [Vicinamibacteria bacterium]
AIVVHSCEVTHRRAYAFAADVPGHRADASCCLDAARAAAASVTTASAEAPACGSGSGCGSSGDEAAVPLIQIRRRPA